MFGIYYFVRTFPRKIYPMLLVRLDSLRVDLIDKKISFDEITQYVSQDKDTRNNKGLMVNPQTGNSKFEMGQLPQDVAKVVADLKVGEISKTVCHDRRT